MAMPTTFPTPDELRNARVQAGMAGDLPSAPVRPAQPTTAQVFRENAARELDELTRFTALVAGFFGCPGLNCDAGRNRMRVAFSEARQMARFYGVGQSPADTLASSKVRRDASGRFARSR